MQEEQDTDRDILRLVRLGATNKAIAYQLGLAISTVKWRLTRLMRRRRVSNRAALAALPTKSERMP